MTTPQSYSYKIIPDNKNKDSVLLSLYNFETIFQKSKKKNKIKPALAV